MFKEADHFTERVWHFITWLPLLRCVWVCVCIQLCLTLWDSMGCNLPGSSVHGIFQARILERVAISYSRGSSQLRDWTHVSSISCIGRQILYRWEAQCVISKAYFVFDTRDLQVVTSNVLKPIFQSLWWPCSWEAAIEQSVSLFLHCHRQCRIAH